MKNTQLGEETFKSVNIPLTFLAIFIQPSRGKRKKRDGVGEQRWKEKWGGEEAGREKAIEKVPPSWVTKWHNF